MGLRPDLHKKKERGRKKDQCNMNKAKVLML